MELPTAITEFLAELNERAPGIKPALEPGGKAAGNWWIDVPGRRSVSVEWRPAAGFGLSFKSGAGYGEGPDEVFKTPQRAARRVAQVLTARADEQPMRLRAIRELYGATQEELAYRLKRRQAAVSKLERRQSVNVDTVSRYVHALGGHLEINAVFPDSRLAVYTTKTETRSSHGSTKSHRLARA